MLYGVRVQVPPLALITMTNEIDSFYLWKIRGKSLPFAALAVFVPLLVLGGVGLALYLALDKNPVFLIISVLCSFLTTIVVILTLGPKLGQKIGKKYASN